MMKIFLRSSVYFDILLSSFCAFMPGKAVKKKGCEVLSTLTQSLYSNSEMSNMQHFTIAEARPRIFEILDDAINGREAVFISAPNGNAVLMSDREYENLLENLYVRSDADDYSRLIRSIEHLESGQGQFHELADYE